MLERSTHGESTQPSPCAELFAKVVYLWKKLWCAAAQTPCWPRCVPGHAAKQWRRVLLVRARMVLFARGRFLGRFVPGGLVQDFFRIA